MTAATLSATTAYIRLIDALRARGSRVREHGGDRALAQCPTHDDGEASLSITRRPGTPGRALVFCHAGCQTADVVAALGLELRDLYDGSPERIAYPYDNGRTVTREYPQGSRGKRIRQANTDRPAELWRLATVREAVAAGADVLIAEGEEDALTLDALALAAGVRIAATTAPQGAANWGKVDYSPLAGARVVIVADNDTAGIARAAALADHLPTVGAEVCAVMTAPEGLNDVTDALAAWTGAEPMTLNDLRAETVGDYLTRTQPIEVEHVEPPADLAAASRLITGGGFVLDTPDHASAIWGDGERVAWAEGESCMIYSPPGTGKTTLSGLLLRGRLGLQPSVLGMRVRPGAGRVLYLAMDRPQQIARALRRQFDPSERAALDDRLTVWRGPLPSDLASQPTLLLDLARAAEADTVIVDSLKDAAARLAEDEGGRQYNLARQHALAEGVELLELHHARKATSEGRKGLSLDDVYGSTWITAGAGSVLAIIGEPGDTAVEIRGVKTARGDVGPLRVTVDREAGTMTAEATPSVLDALRGQGALLAKVVSQLVHGRDNVSAAEISRTRRELERMSDAGAVERLPIAPIGGGPERVAYRLQEGS